jgi:hypothetical protein
MGVRTALFAAPSHSVASTALTLGPSQADGLDHFESSVDHVPLATLGALLIDGSLFGPSFEPLNRELAWRESVAEGGEDGPWIYAVPDRTTSALASLPPERRSEVAAQWGESEERSGPARLRETAITHLEYMVPLAQRARAAGNRLYLWLGL